MRTFRALAVLCLLSIATALAAEIPRPAPDFVINLAANKQIKLSQYRDKTVVLAFILTYCSHCQALRAKEVTEAAAGAGSSGER